MSTLSAILLVGALQGLIVCSILFQSKLNANRFLAALVFLVSLDLVPYILGFSGFYQRFKWLSYAPFELESGFGPLLYLYVFSLVRGATPRKWGWHLVPVALEFLYYTSVFVRSLEFKDDWYNRFQVHFEWFDTVYGLVSLGVYLGLSIKLLNSYRTWAEQNQGSGDPELTRFLSRTLALFGATWVITAGFQLFSYLKKDSTYLDSYGLYCWTAILIYVIGTGALKFAGRIPVQRAEIAKPELEEPDQNSKAEKDWKGVAEKLQKIFESKEMWADPDLTLDSAAAQLKVSSSYLSKALNLGIQESFSVFVSRHRIQAVCLRLEATDLDILELAFEAGFNSKASFNRCFKQVTGQTPREYRNQRRSGSE